MVIAARDDRKRPPRKKQESPHQAELTPPAGVLLALLSRRPRSWSELELAGFNAANLPAAVRELTSLGHEVLIGPVRVVLGDQIAPEADAAWRETVTP
jgi:hypothetical protein